MITKRSEHFEVALNEFRKVINLAGLPLDGQTTRFLFIWYISLYNEYL